MQASYAGPLAEYNSLRDEHLAEYFSSPLRKRHLRGMGLITRDGRIVDAAALRMNAARQDHKRRTRELLASSIVDKAVELERKRRVELKKKLEQLAKYEQVEKVKSQKRHPLGVQDFNPYYTGKTPPLPRSQFSATLQTHYHQLGMSSITRQQGVKKTSGARSIATNYSSPLSSRLPTPIPRPPSTPKPKAAVTVSRRRTTLRKRPTTAPPHNRDTAEMSRRNQVHSDVQITLCFIGKSLHLDGWADSTHSEVTVLQQHCTVPLFKGRVQPKECFTFTSRRHLGMPFGLALYLDGMIDSRVSACCEYKHQCGRRLGSKSAHFRVVKVEGGRPCYRCVAEREAQQEPSGGAGLEKGEGLITDLEEPAELEMQFGNTHRVQERRDEVVSPVEVEIDLNKHRKPFVSNDSSSRLHIKASSVHVAPAREKGRSSPKNGHGSPSDRSQLPDTSSEVLVPPIATLHVTAPSEGEEFDLGTEYSDDAFEEDENAADGNGFHTMEGDWNPSSTTVGSNERAYQIPEVQPESNLALSDSEADLPPAVSQESPSLPATTTTVRTPVGPPSDTGGEKETEITPLPPQASEDTPSLEGGVVHPRPMATKRSNQPIREDLQTDVIEDNNSSKAVVVQQTALRKEKAESQTAVSPSDQTLQHEPVEPRHDGDLKVTRKSDTLPSILVTPERQKSSTMRSTLSVSFGARTLENYATSDQELSEVESDHSYSPPGTPEPGEEPLSATMTLEDAQNMLKSSSAYSLGSLLYEKESEYASTVDMSGSEDEDIPDLERKVSEIHSQVGVRDSTKEESESETGTRAVSSAATRLSPGSSPSRVLQDKTNIADDRIVVMSPVHVHSEEEEEEEEGEQGESPEHTPEAQTVVMPEKNPKVNESRNEFLGRDKIVIAELFETPRSSSELKTPTESNGSQTSNNESSNTMTGANGERSEESSNQMLSEAVQPSPPLPETDPAGSRESLHPESTESRLQTVVETKSSEVRDAEASGADFNTKVVTGDSDIEA